MRTYEQIAGLLEQLASPAETDQFHVEWLEPNRVAVGRDVRERHALLIVGPQIDARDEVVAQSLRYGTWRSTSGEMVTANLLHLPRGDAFRTATAAIAAELFRRGIDARPSHGVFIEVEPFIALVLRRVLLPDDFVLGLVGELLVLRDLFVALGSKLRGIEDPTVVWRGWQRQPRDFVLGPLSIEVKTTGLNVSRHTISGLDQIEPRRLEDQATEELFLASIGLRRAATAGGLSISGLADEIVGMLREGRDGGDEPATKFVDRLSQYGPEGFQGYRHPEMREQESYSQTFTTTFAPRIYDMGDRNIQIIRRADLAREFPLVLPHSIRYSLELPGSVPGSIENPRTDIESFLRYAGAKLWP